MVMVIVNTFRKILYLKKNLTECVLLNKTLKMYAVNKKKEFT